MRPLIAGVAVLVSVGTTTAAMGEWLQWQVSDGGNGHFYQLVSAPAGINWNDANTAAEDLGGYLATITSAAENEFVYALAADDAFWHRHNSTVSHGPWLGGLQLDGAAEPDGGWQWVTGEAFDYDNWYPGLPDDGATGSEFDEDRIHFWYRGSSRAPTWNDAAHWDTNIYGFVAELAVAGVPEPSTVVLLGLAAGGLLAYAWRERRR
jgi:hypothetical protein